MTTSPLHKPKAAVAVALSVLLPGLGQVYSGDRRRGFAILISVEMLVWLKLALHALTSNAGSIFASGVGVAGWISTLDSTVSCVGVVSGEMRTSLYDDRTGDTYR